MEIVRLAVVASEHSPTEDYTDYSDDRLVYRAKSQLLLPALKSSTLRRSD